MFISIDKCYSFLTREVCLCGKWGSMQRAVCSVPNRTLKLPLPNLRQKECCRRDNGKNIRAEDREKRQGMLSSGLGTATAT